MINLPFKHVLVPTDFSPHSEIALARVLDAAEDPDNITALHVGAPRSGYVAADPAVVWETVSEEHRREVLEAEFRKRTDDPRRKGIKFEVAFGTPGDEIAKYADKHNCDLIVMPSHGRTGLTRLLIGSVAEAVVRHAHCPVLILRE
ncbi:MAG: universal stress protein [Planctomycetota bacterium]